jgi:hypothetical protein
MNVSALSWHIGRMDDVWPSDRIPVIDAIQAVMSIARSLSEV